MAKVTVDNLSQVVGEILDEYGDEVKKNLDEVTKRVAKSGVQALKASSKSTFMGNKYWKSWTATQEKSDRWGSSYVIHSTMPGLPHLLENGHATRNGGRVDGRPHIKPVEDQLVTEYIKGVERSL